MTRLADVAHPKSPNGANIETLEVSWQQNHEYICKMLNQLKSHLGFHSGGSDSSVCFIALHCEL